MNQEEKLQELEKQLAMVAKELDTVRVNAAIDKSVERWTWERYQRIEKQLLPKIDKMIERWTWERYRRIWNDFGIAIGKIDNLQNIQGGRERQCFDVIVPIGKACRPAKHLSENRLRVSAYPMDWMKKYDIKTLTHLFETGFEDFFVECVEDEEQEIELHKNPAHGDKRYVIDTKNNISSIHHFFIKDSFEKGKEQFLEKMTKRAKLLMSRLSAAEKILFIGNRDESREELKEFLTAMQQKCFQNADITLINMRHDDKIAIDAPMKIFREDEGKWHFCEYTFNDTHETGGYDGWIGKAERWNSVLKDVGLTSRFKEDNEKRLRAFIDD